MVRFAALNLFRSHVPRRAQNRTRDSERGGNGGIRRAGYGGLTIQFGQPEIQHLHPRLGYQDISRLQIAMNHAMAVRMVDRFGNLDGEAQHFGYRQRTLDLISLNELHHQVVRAHIVESTDIGMIQRTDGLRFPLKPFAEFPAPIP